MDSGLPLESYEVTPSPQLISMKDALNKKTQNYPSICSANKNPDEQQEGEHEMVQHIQEEHYQRSELKVSVIVSGPEGNPDS